MAKQNILNDSTTWGAEATKIEANFDELYNEKAFHGYGEGEEPKTLKEVEDNASVKIENLVVNGDFRNGTTGWAIIGAPDITITDNIATIIPNVTGAGIIGNTNFKIDNTYYFRVEVKGRMDFRLRVGPGGAVEYQTGYAIYPDWSTFTYQRKMVNNDVDLHLLGFNDTQLQLQRVQAINLTETFGAGNEPAKEEMDLLISTLGIDYFEGEITIPAQKIMQWQWAIQNDLADKFLQSNYKFRLGAMNIAGIFSSANNRVVSERIFFDTKELGKKSLELNLPAYVIYSSYYAFSGDTPVKTIPDYSIYDGTFTYDGTFDNVVLCFKKDNDSDFTEAEISEFNVSLRIGVDTLNKLKVSYNDFEQSLSMKADAKDIDVFFGLSQAPKYAYERADWEFGSINTAGININTGLLSRIRLKDYYYAPKNTTIENINNEVYTFSYFLYDINTQSFIRGRDVISAGVRTLDNDYIIRIYARKKDTTNFTEDDVLDLINSIKITSFYKIDSALQHTVDSNLLTDSKVLSGAINEINSKSLEIIKDVDVIFDKDSDVTIGEYIGSTGLFTPSSLNFANSGYIQVEGGRHVAGTFAYAFAEYDDEFKLIPGSYVQNDYIDRDLSADTKYIAFSVSHDYNPELVAPEHLLTARLIYGTLDDLGKPTKNELRKSGIKTFVEQSKYSIIPSENLSQSLNAEEKKNTELFNFKHEIQGTIDSLVSLKSTETGQIEINVPPIDVAVDNRTVKIGLHYGAQRGDTLWDELFFNGLCRPDFSDIRFKDEYGNPLNFIIHTKGNYDFVRDSMLPDYNGQVEILSDNSIIISKNGSVAISSDDGATWDIIPVVGGLVFVDSNDNIYVQSTSQGNLSRYVKADNYATRQIVHTFPPGVNTAIDKMAEDADGNLYLGTYQAAFHCEILKSTDSGITWNRVYFNDVNQHVHSITVDPYTTPNAIYAGLDGVVGDIQCIKSVDSGETWTKLPIPFRNADYGVVYCGDGFRLCGGEASNIVGGGVTIYKTKDDINFYPVLNTHQRIAKTIFDFNGAIYCSTLATEHSRVAQTLVSYDEGESWQTANAENFSDTESAGQGFRYYSRNGIPTGAAEEQVIMAANYDWPEHPELAYRKMRLFSGGENYFALAYVDIGDLPLAGKKIYAEYGYMVQYPKKKVFKEVFDADILMRIRMNEGFGNYLTEDISGKSFKIENEGQWVDFNSNRFGDIYPYFKRDSTDKGLRFSNRAFVNLWGLSIPNNNFTLIFWINMNGLTETRKFVLGDPKGAHLYFQNYSLYFTDGVTEYHIMHTILYHKTDVWHRIVVTFSDDVNPTITGYIDDYKKKETITSNYSPIYNNMYLGGAGYLEYGIRNTISALSTSLNCSVSDLIVLNKALVEREVRDSYYGANYY